MAGIRRFAVAVLLSASAVALAQAPAPAPAPAPRFDIDEFVIEGNTLFQPYELNALVRPYAGKQRDFGDIQRALEALQDFYTERGYNAVRVLIPEQDIRAGRVRLQVLEARIRNVRIEGNRYYNNENVRASLPALQEGEAPNTKRIGENVQLANENPVRQQRVVLESTEEVGKVDASVKVTDDDPYRVSVFFDNTGNGTTGYYRAGFGVVNANFDNKDQVINVQVITSPTQWDDVLILGVGYRVPLYNWNAVLDAYAGYSDVESGTVADLFSVAGSGSILGLRFTQILTRYGAYEQKLSLGVEQKAFTNDVVLIGGSTTLVPDVTTQPLLLTYYGRHAEPGRDFTYTLGLAQNLPSNRGDASQFAIDQARPGASDQFRIWRASAAYSRAIGGDAIVRVAVDGQYTRDVLVPGEQYGIGGVNSVRGYFEREVANDIGHRVSLEAYGPEIGQSIGADWRARMLMFIDMGRGRDNVPVRLGENGLGSIGFGARANRGRNVALRFDYAMVTNQGGTRDQGKGRLHFGAAYTF
jgi:hemolysin activation/secretion protein